MNTTLESAKGVQSHNELEELLRFVRETVPQPNALLQLQIKDPPGVVSFRWHQRDYIVKPPFQVFELRGKDVFVTASSMLLQAAFMRKSRTSKVVEAAVETLAQVESFIKARSADKGVILLGTVKKTLAGLTLR